MRAIVNGQLVEVNPGTTVKDLKERFPEMDLGETIVKVSGTKAEVKSVTALIEPEGKYRALGIQSIDAATV